MMIFQTLLACVIHSNSCLKVIRLELIEKLNTLSLTNIRKVYFYNTLGMTNTIAKNLSILKLVLHFPLVMHFDFSKSSKF